MNFKTAFVVLHYNKVNQTKECINSIISSKYSTEDVFCFDNGSTEDVFIQLQQEFPQINHKREEINNGYSGGFNNAINWAFKSEYNSVLFLTNDTRITADTVKELLKTARITNSELIAPTIYYQFKKNTVDSSGGYFNPDDASLHHYKDKDNNLLLNKPWDYIPGTAFWITKNAFYKLGGMDESYHTYWEDVDFSFRARKSGIVLAKSRNSKIFHGVGRTCHKKPEYTTFYFHRNRIKFCKKHLDGVYLKKCLKIIDEELNGLREKFIKKGDKKRLEYIERIINNF
jgi:GT2 family glycosyltransferase